MDGMNVVGDLFGAGQDVPAAGGEVGAGDEAGRRLPQPFMEAEKQADGGADRTPAAGKIVLATVKGDVHDIGKNIVGVVLAVQQLRGHRPRRDGAGGEDPGDGDGARTPTSSASPG